ncbi:MAG: rod shape-determining protein MreD [Acidobacteria bacterium RBG_16_70_10]|nr:MAG: rod shape-determining protein MreD [Acidobacteria bacterium RBG_16_70_10]
MKTALWTATALLGAFLIETALGRLVSAPGWLLDPFLLVVVYCALVGGETHGMLTGMVAGWVQDMHFGGRVLGIAALAKLVVGFAVGLAGAHFLLGGTGVRALVILLASIADSLLVQWLASVFSIDVMALGPLTLASRAAVNATAGGALFALLEHRARRAQP